MALSQFIPRKVNDDFWSNVGIPSRGKPLLVAIDAGFPYETLKKLSLRMGFEVSKVSAAAGFKSATLARRAKDGRFKPTESDGIHRIAEVYNSALSLFEDNDELAHNWMNSPVKALGDNKPIDMLKTNAQINEVLNAIGRLENGVVN